MFWRVLFTIISIFIICERLTRPYADSDDATLDYYCGKKRCGKTTILTAKAIYYQLKGRKVYANYKIPGCYYFNPKIIGTNFHYNFGDVIIVDEIGIVFNSRNWETNLDDKKIEWFKTQGHYGVKVIIASQSPTDFDKILRDLTDNIYIVKKLLRVFVMARPVSKKIDIANSESGSSLGGQIVFLYRYMMALPKFYFIPRYVPFFDSFSRPEAGREMPSEFIEISEVQKDLRTIKGASKVLFSRLWVNTKHSLFMLLKWLKRLPGTLKTIPDKLKEIIKAWKSRGG